MTYLPPEAFRDLKTQDTTGDKVLRTIGLVFWAMVIFIVAAADPVVGLILLAVSLLVRWGIRKRRRERYDRNAAKLAVIHQGGGRL